MAGRSVRKDRANKRNVTLAVIVTFVFVAVFSVLILNKHHENELLRANEAALTESVSQEEVRNDILEEKKDRDLTLEEIIELARKRFGLVFPNEIIFVPKD